MFEPGVVRRNYFSDIKLKRERTVRRAMTTVSLLMILCLMSAVAQAVSFNEYEVQFEVKANKGEVAVKSNNKNCNKGQGQKKGCIRFPENSIGLIKFYIGNKNHSNTCSDPNTKWVISRVELSDQGYLVVDKTDSSKTTVSDKGIFEDSNLPLDQWLKDSFPQLDKATGYLYDAPTPLQGVTQVTSLNLNNNLPADGVKDIWYRVSVTRCGSDPADVETLTSDPRFENDGSDPS